MAQPHASSSKMPSQKIPVTLTPELMARFKPSKVFPEAVDKSAQGSSTGTTGATNPQITSVSFDDAGERCLVTGEDEAFSLWDMRKGKKLKTFYSKKYGLGIARFTHRAGNIVHASGKPNEHALRYHSTHDNKYLTYFVGHTARVRSLLMNPTNDTFLSAGDDGTVRMWDLRTQSCVGLLNDVGGSVVAAVDNSGAVFAAACTQTQTIMLYAIESMDSAPFFFAHLDDPALEQISMPPPTPTYTSIHFSSNGHYILLGTSLDVHYLLDAFELHPLRRLTGHKALGAKGGEEVCFTADSRFVISGSADGAVCMWDLGTEQIAKPPDGQRSIQTLQAQIVVKPGGPEQGMSRCVRFNPRLCTMAVGGDELSMWLPVPSEEERLEEGY